MNLSHVHKRILLTVAAILSAAMLLLQGCGNSSGAGDPPASAVQSTQKTGTIHMTYVKSPLNIPSILEKKDQIFENAFQPDGISVEYADLDAGPKQTEAIAAGRMDICHALGGTSAILAAANGIDLKIVGIYSRAPEAFMLMVKDPSIQSVKDLKGKTIAGPKGTILHQLLLAALKKEGMGTDDVKFVSMGIPQASAALAGGSADAALLAGPATLKMQNEGARILTTGKGLLDATIVIAMRNDFIKEHPDTARKFMDTHQQVVTNYMADPQSAYAITAAETGLNQEQVSIMAKWYDFDPAIRAADIIDLEETQDFLIQTGMLEKDKKINIQELCASL